MKAIEKDRERRYQGAGELAGDIERHLHHQPVSGRSTDSESYRIGKFVRRHRVGVLATAVVTVALIAGLTASLIGFRQAVSAAEDDRPGPNPFSGDGQLHHDGPAPTITGARAARIARRLN